MALIEDLCVTTILKKKWRENHKILVDATNS